MLLLFFNVLSIELDISFDDILDIVDRLIIKIIKTIKIFLYHLLFIPYFLPSIYPNFTRIYENIVKIIIDKNVVNIYFLTNICLI